MSLKSHTTAALFLLCFSLVTVLILLPADTARAQAVLSGWGSASWFDWSDFRAVVGYRIMIPQVSGTVDARGESHSLSDFGINDEMDTFKSFYAEVYVDRFGIRVNVEDNFKFRGRIGEIASVDDAGNPNAALTNARISELVVSGVRVGVDVDLIRTPYFRAGIDWDYHMDKAQFLDRRSVDQYLWEQHDGGNAMTAGVHARAIPMRLREVPFTVQARARFPLSFWQDKQHKIDIIDWEVSGGLRPSVWETSLFGHTTFSIGIEAGFRATYLNMTAGRLNVPPPGTGQVDTHVKARWWGPFVQAAIFY